MPPFQNRQQARSEELSEFSVTGPFGGIQSELPPTAIEDLGFLDSSNVLFRKGAAYVRPGYTALPAFPDGNTALAIADFYNANGVHLQVAMTKIKLFKWTGSAWTEITGTGFTGGATQLFGWDVVGQKLCFSQGVDKIWAWDGIAAGYVQTSASAPASANIAEIGLHLMCLNTVEGGNSFPQRYHWSGAGDPTDWTSFSSGLNDNLNNLGPGTALLKLGQYGFGWHFNGIVQIQPTGIGTAPFVFGTIVSSSIGDILPKSIAKFSKDGLEQAVFGSYDNIYIFNQSAAVPIGDQPLDGRRRIGARSRIIGDLQSGGTSSVFGYVTTSINGQPFNAYWLIIPGISTWVYNLDEANWTVIRWDRSAQVAGEFFKSAAPRIIDLVGKIGDQSWSPATIVATNPFPGFAVGFTDGSIGPGYIDFTNYSESSGQIVSGKCICHDARHQKTNKKFRLRVLDLGTATYTITVSNNFGVSVSRTVTIGNGSGDERSVVVEFPVPGLRLQWTVAFAANTPGAMTEFCLIYDTSGEQRGGNVDESTVVTS